MNTITQTEIERDLDRLISDSHQLQHAMNHACFGRQYEDQLEKAVGRKNKDETIFYLPNFKQAYQAWYSEALSLIKQLLPDRADDFASYYEYTKPRKEFTTETYMIRDYLQGIVTRRPNGKVKIDGRTACPKFVQQVAIVEAARKSLSSMLVQLTSILQSDLFNSEVRAAKTLADAGYLRAAGAICGVVIEKHLHHVCINRRIEVKKNAGISNYNDALKRNGTIATKEWRFVQVMADIRNLCDHAGASEPSKEDIEKLFLGTDEIIKIIS